MAKPKRGPSAYNTPYDELPEYFAIFSPYTWLWLLEILLLLLGGAILLVIITTAYLPFSPKIYFLGVVIGGGSVSILNALLAYGYDKSVLFIQLLCLTYIMISLPNLFLIQPFMSLFPIFSAALVLWITTTQKFRVFVLHRVKMGAWRREQLEKNKVRREVIKERKAKEKAARRS
jgi:hypothetical protein